MPTNLPPEAFEAERKYREATTVSDKVKYLEEYISAIPKHKGTDKLRADLRRKLSKLKSEGNKSKKQGSRQETAFQISREGDGQVAVTGLTNVGKSSLVSILTNARPKVFEAPYTTWEPTPGMMEYENIKIQLIDTPPLNRDYVNPELFELIKKSDVILLMVDLKADPFKQLEEGVKILEEHRIAPVRLKGKYPSDARMIFIPFLVLANKCDDQTQEEDFRIFGELLDDNWPSMPISASTGYNLEKMKEIIFRKLNIIRIYSKPHGKEPDMSAPFVLKTGSNVEDFAAKVHRDFLKTLKTAHVWGKDVYDGQLVARDHILNDGDIVELCI
ncbi:MAG: TGS domain-containing protein [Bacteroidales bacterium]|nr:TGS domain-containing protein [Bacteroidales bacterium]